MSWSKPQLAAVESGFERCTRYKEREGSALATELLLQIFYYQLMSLRVYPHNDHSP